MDSTSTGLDNPRVLDLYTQAIETYTVPAQEDMVFEEAAELIISILKRRRAHRKGNKALLPGLEDNIHEEIADVQVMLDQLKLIYGNAPVLDYVKDKQDRLAEKLGLIKLWEEDVP